MAELTAMGPTYEGFTFVYDNLPGPSRTQREQNDARLRKAFIHPSFPGPARCVATSGSLCVLGGADDTVRALWVQRSPTPPDDLGAFASVSGSPSCLAFCASASHLIAGSSDGSLELIRTLPSWRHLALLRGHQSAITSIAPHPSGLATLSCSRDRSLRLWDLSTGSCVYKCKLHEPAQSASFMPSGNTHCLLGQTTASMSDTSRGIEVLTLRPPQHPLCLSPWSTNCAAIGCEAGSFCLLDYRMPDSLALSLDRLHNSRLKGICSYVDGNEQSEYRDQRWPAHFISASTDGTVRVFDARKLSSTDETPYPISETTGAGRFTGFALARQHQANDPVPGSVSAMERPNLVPKEQQHSLEQAQRAEEMLDKAWYEYKVNKAKRRRQIESGHNPDKDNEHGEQENNEEKQNKANAKKAGGSKALSTKMKKGKRSAVASGAAQKQSAFKQKAKEALQRKKSKAAKKTGRQGLPKAKSKRGSSQSTK